MPSRSPKRDKAMTELSGPALPEVSAAKFFVETAPGKKVVVEIDAQNAGTDFQGPFLRLEPARHITTLHVFSMQWWHSGI
jgi:hypothetical protein